MKRISISLLLLVSVVVGMATPAAAGGPFESYDITNAGPSPIPGHILARMVGIRWDTRSIPVQYSINTTLNPVPNPLGPAFLSVAQAQAAMQESFDQWNNIPTSYIDMRITRTTNNPGLVGFDMVNELSFRTAAGFGAIASSPSVNLIVDITLNHGDRIDNDADPDVSSAITTATDVDGDGDIEFPAGFYKAGTILDNDVQFNTKVSNGFRFTIEDDDLDIVTRSVGLQTVATHEFGHSQGLSHSMVNQTSSMDGDGATMFPLIDTGDPVAEAGQGILAEDDISWSSYIYQEGTAATGPAALQPGDKAFNRVYGLITGSLHHGVQGRPLVGASAAAMDWDTGAIVSSGYSGTALLSFNPANGGLFFVPDPDVGIQDGKYVIPVPKGSYAVAIEGVDGSPNAAGQISFTTQIGNFYGQQNFAEEYWNNNSEKVVEKSIGQRKNVPVNPGNIAAGVNFVTSDVINISNFGIRSAIGFINPPPGGFMYAVRVPASQIAAIDPGQNIAIQGAAFDTHVVDASAPVLFAQAMLTTGTIDPSNNTAALNLTTPLRVTDGFLAQETDLGVFYFSEPHDLGKQVRAAIAAGTIENLFIVLKIPPAPFPGVSNQPPLVGLSTQAPVQLLSYLSTDGGATFNRRNTQDFRFSLVLSQPVTPSTP